MAAENFAVIFQRVRGASAFVVLMLLSLIASRLAACWLDRAFWHRPLRHPEPVRERSLRATAELLSIIHSGKRVVAYAWGRGPLVLLVHGWSGRGLQFGALVEPLVRQGYRVVTFDAPAHGHSPGRHVSFPAIAEIIGHIIARSGPLHAIVAHSAGCTPALLAAQHASTLRRVVCISPFASLRSPLRDMYRKLRVSARVAEAHERRLMAQYGEALYETYSPQCLVRAVTAAGLIVHDAEDPETAPSEAETLLRAWPGAKLMVTHGLGHYRLLRDPAVVREIAGFIGPPERTAASYFSPA